MASESDPALQDVLARGNVRLEVGDGVATITLDLPERHNAQTPLTWDALREAGRALTADVRVVVVRAEGPSFSAGLDRAMFTPEGIDGIPSVIDLAKHTDEAWDEQIAAWQRGFDWLWRNDIVSIAAVQGHAIGAGFQLALACDLRVAAEDAQFRMAEPALGLVPDLTGTKRLVDLVGTSRAMDYCLTARVVAADEAERAGLVNRVVARDALDDAVAGLVSSLLAVPRDAAVATKALLSAAPGRTQSEQQVVEGRAQIARLRALVGAVAD